MAIAPTPTVVAAPGATLGEGPIWDEARQCLWFVDIKRHHLYRLDPQSEKLDRWDTPGEIGWALPTDEGDMLCGLQDGLYRFDPAGATFAYFRAVEPQRPGNRLNDATTDPAGRVWFGSMDNGERDPSGRFYRMRGGRIDAVGPGPVCITNGPAVAPDGRTIYFTDTLARIIYAADLDAGGEVGEPHLFVRFGEEQAGYPDGPTVDAAGNVWTGMFAGWSALCFDPAGELIETVRFPVANITKLAFGGPDFATAYATTASKGLSAAELAAQPDAGHVFAFKPRIGGVAPTLARLGD